MFGDIESISKELNFKLMARTKIEDDTTIRAAFGKRLKEAAQAYYFPDFKASTFAKELGVSGGTVSGWFNGTSFPSPHKLKQIAEMLGKSLDDLCEVERKKAQPAVNDPIVSIIGDDDKYREKRRKVIAQTKKSLWIQLRVGYTLEESKNDIFNVMHRTKGEAEIRLLISSPTDRWTLKMIERRNYDRLSERNLIKQDIRKACADLLKLAKDAKCKEKVHIMYLPYFPSTIYYISDAGTGHGQSFTSTTNFREDPYLAPVVVAKEDEHPTLFAFYVEQYKLLWNYGAEMSKPPQKRM
jgi:transcriptional regulator with XRE-family HTH domain